MMEVYGGTQSFDTTFDGWYQQAFGDGQSQSRMVDVFAEGYLSGCKDNGEMLLVTRRGAAMDPTDPICGESLERNVRYGV